jgi:nucleoside-triphosphatase
VARPPWPGAWWPCCWKEGVAVGGFTTGELGTGGRREGFVVEAVSGARGVLAHLGLPGPPRVGSYGVDLAAFERVALSTLRAPGPGRVVVVDGLGTMELASAAFCAAVLELVGRDVAVVATVPLARHQLPDALRGRPDVRVVRVTEASRDALPRQLRDCLVGATRGEAKDRGPLRAWRRPGPSRRSASASGRSWRRAAQHGRGRQLCPAGGSAPPPGPTVWSRRVPRRWRPTTIRTSAASPRQPPTASAKGR